MNAKALVDGSVFQLRLAEIKRVFPEETDESTLLLYVAKKYYAGDIFKVNDIVRSLREADASAPLEKIDLVTERAKYLTKLDEDEKAALKLKKEKADDYATKTSEYNKTFNKINSLNYDVQTAKDRKRILKVGLIAGGIFGFFGIGGFAGIAYYTSLLTLPLFLGIIAIALVGSSIKRWYDNNIKRKKEAQLAEKQKELEDQKAKEPEKKKERDSARTAMAKAENDYTDAVSKKSSETSLLTGMKVRNILQVQADLTIKNISDYADSLLPAYSGPADSGYRAVLSWKKHYTKTVGYLLAKGKIANKNDLDTIYSSFETDVNMVSGDPAYSADLIVGRRPAPVLSTGPITEKKAVDIETEYTM